MVLLYVKQQINRSPNSHIPQIKLLERCAEYIPPHAFSCVPDAACYFPLTAVYVVRHIDMKVEIERRQRESSEISYCTECSKILFTRAPYHKMQEAASHDYAKQQHFAHRL